MRTNTDTIKESCTQTAAASRLNISISSIGTLIGMDLLEHAPNSTTKVKISSVEELQRRKQVPLPDHKGALLLARKSPADKFTTNSLYFDPVLQSDHIDKALDKFVENYGSDSTINVEQIVAKVKSGEYAVTGYWVCPERYLPAMTDGGVIAGTTLGWISQAAEIIAHAYTLSEGKDKVFIVRPFLGDELEPWLCYQDIMAPRVKSEAKIFSSKPVVIPDKVQQEFFCKAKALKDEPTSYPAIIIGKSGKPEVFVFNTP